MKKKASRLLSLVMAAVMICGVSPVAAYAANVELPNGVRAYPSGRHDSANQRVWVYYDEELTNRSEKQWVSVYEEVKVLDFSFEHGSVLIEYNTAKGKMQRWTDMRILFPTTDSDNFKKMVAHTTIRTYQDPGRETRYGSVSPGDDCWVCTQPQAGGFRVIYPLGGGGFKAGWVDDLSGFTEAEDLIPELPEQPEQDGTTMTVILSNPANTLRVRFGPGTNYNVLTRVHHGDEVKVLSIQNGWAHVVLDDGQEGYVSSRYLIPKVSDDTPSGAVSYYISVPELNTAAAQHGISIASDAYRALKSINTKYADQLTDAQKRGTVVFMFEGVGSDSSPNKRMNAMCVVVENGQIDFISRNCSTLPDYPFSPSKNGGSNMPTLQSGIYAIKNWNHNGSYAALKVIDADVVRFSDRDTFYESTSTAINVHRRSSNSIAGPDESWVNSAGCLLVGTTGKSATGEYARFVQALGIVGSSARGDVRCSSPLTGTLVLDRGYGHDYLRSVGYPEAAMNFLG